MEQVRNKLVTPMVSGKASIRGSFVKTDTWVEVGVEGSNGLKSNIARQAYDTEELYEIVAALPEVEKADLIRCWQALGWVWETGGEEMGIKAVKALAFAVAYVRACSSVSHRVVQAKSLDVVPFLQYSVVSVIETDISKIKYPGKVSGVVNFALQWTGKMGNEVALGTLKAFNDN